MNESLQPGAAVVAYLRDSGGRDQDQSIDQQLRQVEAWCDKNHLLLVRTFADTARSGTTLVGREAFDQALRWLLDDATPQAVAGVVFWSYARFAREVNDAQFYLAGLRRAGYAVASMLEPIPDGNVGIIVEAAHLFAAAEYSAKLRQEVKRGLQDLAIHHKARPNPHKPPFGYKFESFTIGTRRGTNEPHLAKRIVPDPDTAPTAIRAFELRAAGWTYREINAELRIYKDWRNIGDLLTNPAYIGTLRYGQLEVPGACAPLVDLGLWAACQERKREGQERYGYNHPRSKTNTHFLLNGLLRCAFCGEPMYAAKPTDRVSYYRCFKRTTACPAWPLRADTLEGLVVAKILEIGQDPALVAEWAESAAAAARAHDTGRELARLENKLSEADATVKRLVEAVASLPDTVELIERLRTARASQRELQKAVARQRELDAVRQPADPASLLQAMAAVFAEGDLRARQNVLRAALEGVTAGRSGTRQRGEISGVITFRPGIGGAVPFAAPYASQQGRRPPKPTK